jgi:DNA-binding NtrC family response regulator
VKLRYVVSPKPDADAGVQVPFILLVGTELPLLEGLSQSLGALGFTPVVAQTLSEARELAGQHPPLVGVVSRRLAAESSAELLSIPLAAGGALVLYAASSGATLALPPALQRSILADLALPLERNRLLALVQHVSDRAHAAGRASDYKLRREMPPPR